MTVEECQRRVSGPEFMQWIAYDRHVCPIGHETRLLAVLCAMLHNALRGSKSKPLAPHDFLGIPGPEPEPSPEEQLAAWRAIAARANARHARLSGKNVNGNDCQSIRGSGA